VILFSDNTTGGSVSVRHLVDSLQAAAAAGANPPLLIMADQEGGEVKRLPWAPPALAPADMSSTALARREGKATGAALRSAGVNVDLAPVADVERLKTSFLAARAFGSNDGTVAARACAFASGLQQEGVAFTLKHFPGLGEATSNTDVGPVTIDASSTSLRAEYGAYRTCGISPDALVMISSGIYPTLTGSELPAVMSPEIYTEELPYATGGHPATISDDLQAGALRAESAPARSALEAGLDLLVYAQTEAGSADAFELLRKEVRSRAIDRSTVARAAQAVERLKVLVAGATQSPSSTTSSDAEYGYDAETPGAPETVTAERGAG
jgi:beta-N-acetylhexosaminidase